VECSELIGYLASALVFATFYMNSMTLLRFFALTSNFAFIAYACLGELFPILALHVALLPLNAWRLLQPMRGDGPTPIGPGNASNARRRRNLRDELLNETMFRSLAHAREVLSEWQKDYNKNNRTRALAGSRRTSLQDGPRRTITRTDSSYERVPSGGKVIMAAQTSKIGLALTRYL
jgi:hypothetical protein